MKNTILLTGATGTIGSELTRSLKAAGADFIVGSRSGRAVDGVPGRAVDFADPASLAQAFAGIDTLFVLLPLVENKVELARNVIAAARRAGVRHIVRSSGLGADAGSPYAIARLQGEIDDLVIGSGLSWTLIRPASFMQNYINFYGGMVAAGTVYLPQADGAISFIDVRDIAAVTARVLFEPGAYEGQTLELTGGEALNNDQVAGILAEVLGKPVQYVAVDDAAAAASLRGFGVPEWNIDQLASLNSIIRAGYAAGTTPTVERVLGRAPTAFRAFAHDHAAAWQ